MALTKLLSECIAFCLCELGSCLFAPGGTQNSVIDILQTISQMVVISPTTLKRMDELRIVCFGIIRIGIRRNPCSSCAPSFSSCSIQNCKTQDCHSGRRRQRHGHGHGSVNVEAMEKATVVLLLDRFV